MTAQQCQRPNVMEAPAKVESQPKAKQIKAAASSKLRLTPKPTMMAILEDSLADQF